MQKIKLEDCSLEQLQVLAGDLQNAIQAHQTQFQMLAVGMNRFENSAKTMATLAAEKDSQQILVPMSSTVYHVGTLNDNKRFTVDVGGGYFLERSVEQQSKYFARRVAQVKGELEKLSAVLSQKKEMLNLCSAAAQRVVSPPQKSSVA